MDQTTPPQPDLSAVELVGDDDLPDPVEPDGSDTPDGPAVSPDTQADTGHRTWLTIKEAMAATGLSRPSLMARIKDDKFPNARQDPEPPHAWRIPVEDLIAAGLEVRAPKPKGDSRVSAGQSREGGRVSARDTGVSAELLARVQRLTQERDDLAHRVELQEERIRGLEALVGALQEALSTLRLAVRALPATTGPGNEPEGGQEGRSGLPGPDANPEPVRPSRTSWWRRTFGPPDYGA